MKNMHKLIRMLCKQLQCTIFGQLFNATFCRLYCLIADLTPTRGLAFSIGCGVRAAVKSCTD